MTTRSRVSGAVEDGLATPAEPAGRGVRERRGQARRRRANATGERREVSQQVWLTATEKRRLRQRAAALDVTVPRLLVESALAGSEAHDGGVGDVPGGVEIVTERRRLMTELMAAHRTLAGAAVNMNQVARKANTTHELPSDFVAVFEDLRRLGGKLEGVVDQLIEANRRDGLEVPRR